MNDFEGLVKGFVRQHRQDGAEDFLLHDGVAGGYPVHDGRRDGAGALVPAAAIHHFGRVDQRTQPLEVAVIDNARQVGTIQRVGAVEVGGFFNMCLTSSSCTLRCTSR